MNTFKVSLSGFGASHVEADRYEEVGDVVRFYRRDSLISEYPKCMVKEVVPLGGLEIHATVGIQQSDSTSSP